MPKKLPPSRPPSRPASGQRGQSRHNAMRQELGGQSAPSWSDTDPLVRADTPTNAGGGTMSLGGDGEGTTWWTVRRKKRAAVGAVLLCGSATILAVVLTQPITFPDCVTGEDGVLDCTERAEALMDEYPLIDGHNDLPHQIMQQWQNQLSKVDLAGFVPTTQTDIPRLRQGKVGAQFWAAYCPCQTEEGQDIGDAVRATLDQIDLIRRMMDAYAEFELATTADGIKKAFERKTIAGLIGVEGGHSIDSSLGALRMFYDLGVRYMTLTHNCNTPWADSATAAGVEHDGISAFGEEVVHEMNRLGMMVDISHVSPDTMRDVLLVTKAPVIFSHSSALALCSHPRNVPTDVLQRMNNNGGVVMVNFYTDFVCCSVDRPADTCSIKDVAAHISYIKENAGIDHVGIGGDFDGVSKLPAGLDDVSTYPALVAELVANWGFSASDIQKVLGGNLLRTMKEVELMSEQIQNPALFPSGYSEGSSTGNRGSFAMLRNGSNSSNSTPAGPSEAYLSERAFEPYLKVLSNAVLQDGQLPGGQASYAPGSPTCRPTTFKVGGIDAAEDPDAFGPRDGN